MSSIFGELNFLRGVVRVPSEIMEGVVAAQKTTHEKGLLKILQLLSILILLELLTVFIDLC